MVGARASATSIPAVVQKHNAVGVGTGEHRYSELESRMEKKQLKLGNRDPPEFMPRSSRSSKACGKAAPVTEARVVTKSSHPAFQTEEEHQKFLAIMRRFGRTDV